MALPSQSERSNSGNRGVMIQPEAGMSAGARIAIIALAVGLMGVAGYAFLSSRRQAVQPTQDVATNPAPADPTRTASVPTQPAPSAGASGTPGGVVPLGQPSVATGQGTPSPTPTTPAATPQPLSQPTTTQTGPAAGTPSTGPVTVARDNTTTAPITPPAPTPAAGTGGAPSAPTTPAIGATATVESLIASGEQLVRDNKLVEARVTLSRALLSPDASETQREQIRAKLGPINEDLVFSARVFAGDPLVESYTVRAGDSLVRIRARRELATDWRLIQRVNRMANPNSVRVGQTLKLVRGPFHAVVNKSAFRVDVFAGSPDDPANWLYIKSYRVGLGAGNSTPIGNYVIKKNSKLINPPWINPRTGERFGADDPKNPIGEHWIGWQGVGDSAVNQGYGFHGTIEPDSIGQERSMGCVRMNANDVAEIYDLLAEEVSVVRVMP